MFSSDWKFYTEALSSEQASENALKEAFRKFGDKLNLSPSICVSPVSSINFSITNEDGIYENMFFFRTSEVLKKIGNEELSLGMAEIERELSSNG